MNALSRFFPEAWRPAAWTLAAFLLLAGLLQFLLLAWSKRQSARGSQTWESLFLAQLSRFQALWLLLLGLAAAASLAPLMPSHAETLRRGTQVIFVMSLSLALAALFSGLLDLHAGRAGLGERGASISRTLLRMAMLGLGALMVLSQLGVSITPLLTALGVGSLAVALALQDTLSNLFAGFYVIMGRQIHVGDYVHLDSGQEGYVDDISWRACRLRELGGSYIILPNQKLAQSIITNYHRPQKEIALVVNLGVAYSSDLARVEAVTCEVAREALKNTDGAIAAFEPFVRYNDFGEGAIKLSVILKIREFSDRFLLIHEFMKKLHARYKAEGIEMPAPRMDLRWVKTPRM